MLTVALRPTRSSSHRAGTGAADARRIRNAAVRSLLAELVTYPKPGLVSLVDTGSHDDMDATTFVRSALSLRRYFEHAATAGASLAPFESLRQLGVAAEVRMMRATRGINTHRGAIFNLGLLAAAAGARAVVSPQARPTTLGEFVAAHWGEAVARHRRPAGSHGSLVSRRHAVGGAQSEAAAGFPSVYSIALPAYRAALGARQSANAARVQAFFALVAELDDTNLLHRGGRDGLAFARDRAAQFLRSGGVLAADWRERAVEIHRAFRERRLSAGGSGDLLAACLFIDAIEG